MINNDILRRLRYCFDLNDSDMIATFAAADYTVTRAEISDWLKKDDDPNFVECEDRIFAIFLNGFINVKRGKKEGPQNPPEKYLNNNLILRKIKIALELRDTDILEILELANMTLSKHELSAFFRKENHKHYRSCQDQILRRFLQGLQKKYKGQ